MFLQHAYKLIPVKREQFYLQGFKWLGKIFFEERLIFGSRSSVPNYDDFHDTVSDLFKVKSNTDRQFLHGRHVLMLVDNIGSVRGYAKGRSKMDPYTSVILTALNDVVLSYSCYLYVHHCPRVSTTAAILADSLSRSDDKGRALAATWCNSLLTHWPPSLLSWMRNPSMDWMLGSKLVRDFI